MKTIPKNLGLTALEADYFELLENSIGKTVKREKFAELHTKDVSYGSNVVDVHMKNIRRKLEGKYRLWAARGVGYRLEKV